MLLIKTSKELEQILDRHRQNGASIGFAPTMGALHLGHVSLVRQAKEHGQLAVCSIFVNPTQFDDKNDLAKYPRTIGQDIDLLVAAGCDVLFLPEPDEVYPADFDFGFELDLGTLDKTMEGAQRKGHFKGVVQVVKRLLKIVRPNSLYMGQKDFQQFTIIGHMIKVLQMPIELVVCPILREPDGLAMSSRNVRLSPEARQLAPMIYRALLQAKEDARTLTIPEIKSRFQEALNRPEFSIDYFHICNPDTLVELQDIHDHPKPVAIVTVKLDGVRLLDNLFFN